jgi:hypothetical protein
MTGLVRDLILSAGKIIIFLGSMATLVLSVGYLFFPDVLNSISKPVNTMFEIEGPMYKNRQVVGVVFLAITVVLFLVLALVR